MTAAGLIVRIMVASISVIAVGAIAVYSFTVIEPFYLAFGEPPEGLGWGSPALRTITFASFGFVGLLLVLIIWFIFAPIRQDRRQQIR